MTNHFVLTLGLALVIAPVGMGSANAQDIPLDGLELWVKADGPMKLNGAQITEWTDLSGKGNHAAHDAFGLNQPTLATANGKPTMRFSGVYTGFHFTKINTVRTVFAVLSKVPASCLPTLPNYATPAKFWIGGNASPTYFHPEHGCSIYNANLSEVSPYLVNGKTYLNGKLVEGRTTQFPFVLGLLSIVATANVAADTIARDRNFQDRSWQGDISELLIYSRPLDDVTRVSIQDTLLKKYSIANAGGSAGGGADGGSPAADASVLDASNDLEGRADGGGSGGALGTGGASPGGSAGGASGTGGAIAPLGTGGALGSGGAVAPAGTGGAPSVGGANGGSPTNSGHDAAAGVAAASAGCACSVGRTSRDNPLSCAVMAIFVGLMLVGRPRPRRDRRRLPT